MRQQNSLTLLHHALRERVSCETRRASASGRVAHHSAFCVGSARTRARVSALQVDASQVTRTLTIGNALWPAVGRRAGVIGQARARRALSSHLTHCVRSTRRRLTGVRGGRLHRDLGCRGNKKIPDVTLSPTITSTTSQHFKWNKPPYVWADI